MNTADLKKIIARTDVKIFSTEISLFQRNLVAEASALLRQVESKAKQLKAGNVVLIAVVLDD